MRAKNARKASGIINTPQLPVVPNMLAETFLPAFPSCQISLNKSHPFLGPQWAGLRSFVGPLGPEQAGRMAWIQMSLATRTLSF